MMIMGNKALSNAPDDMKAEIENILPQRYHLASDEVAAYHLGNKNEDYCQSVINPKTGLISRNELDSASDHITHIFNSLYQNYAKTLKR